MSSIAVLLRLLAVLLGFGLVTADSLADELAPETQPSRSVEWLPDPASQAVSPGFEGPLGTVTTADGERSADLAEPIELTSGLSEIHLFEEPTFPTVRVTGFFQADSVWVDQDAANMSHPAIGDIQDGADFRRARLAATGKVWKNVGYMIEMDFAFPGRPTFMDVYLDINDLPGVGNFRVGQWRQPFGMDALTSVRELTFLERALPFAFVPFRQIGAGVYDTFADENATWAASVMRFPTDPFGGNIGDRGYSFAGRLTGLLLADDDESHLLHVGANFALLNPSTNSVRYQNQPELFVGEAPGSAIPAGVPGNLPPFVDTGIIDADSAQVYGLEAAAEVDSLYLQAEYLLSHVDRIGAANVNFHGAYAYAAYLLTGEVRPYNRKSGAFGRVRPIENFDPSCGGLGAWEVAARWSWIDLNEDDIEGGSMTDLTFGLNWYLNQFTKFQFNYIHSNLRRQPVPSSHANLFALRAQLDF